MSHAYGLDESIVTKMFFDNAIMAQNLVCHNRSFDIDFVKDMIARSISVDSAIAFSELPFNCTMKESVDFCKLPHAKWKNSYKWPRLAELYNILFKEYFDNAHDALADVLATRRCYYELVARKLLFQKTKWTPEK